MYGEIDGLTKVPVFARFAWGARAIKEKRSGFELLGDRMGYRFVVNDIQTGACAPSQQKAFKAFERWLTARALKAAAKWAETQNVNDSELFVLDSGSYHYRATCNASYGYVYMTAWEGELL